MRYYKIVNDGCIVAIGMGNGGEQITETEYTELQNFISNRPITKEKGYHLTVNLEWVEYDIPLVETEPTNEEYAEVGKILLGVSE